MDGATAPQQAPQHRAAAHRLSTARHGAARHRAAPHRTVPPQRTAQFFHIASAWHDTSHGTLQHTATHIAPQHAAPHSTATHPGQKILQDDKHSRRHQGGRDYCSSRTRLACISPGFIRSAHASSHIRCRGSGPPTARRPSCAQSSCLEGS